MRIIAGNDYYDSALGLGQDPTLVFTRKQSDPLDPRLAERSGIWVTGLPPVRLHDDRRDRPVDTEIDLLPGKRTSSRVKASLRPVAVVACGVRYQGIDITVAERSGDDRRHEQDVVWDLDGLTRFLAGFEISVHRGDSVPYLRRQHAPDTPEVYFAPLRFDGPALDLLIERHIAVMTRGPLDGRLLNPNPAVWTVNEDNLKTLAFYKVLDPYAMYQELAQFVGGVLPRAANETVELDDRTRKQKHGFDEKSFRKPPES